MRKAVNFRASLFAAIGVILGILSFYEFLFGDFYFGLIAVILLLALLIGLLILKSKSYRIAAVIIVLMAVGFGLSQLRYSVITSDEKTGEEVTISGRIANYCRNNEDYHAFYLEDCYDQNGARYKGRILVTAFCDEDFEFGESVTVRGALYSVYPLQADVKSGFVQDNVRYEMRSATVVNVSVGNPNLAERIRAYIRNTSTTYMYANGEVVYSLLTGDRSFLSEATETYFSRAGILHLLAVSGLHVGFVVSLLCFVLRRFRLHPLFEGVIVLIPLLFYGYICDFTPSVTRAIIMVGCSYIARAAYGRTDLITSLSWAVLLILLISPFTLFYTGFQLSALSVYGIATIFQPLNRLLIGRGIPKILRYTVNSLVMSAACSMSTLFTMAVNFGEVPTLGILINVAAIPLVSLTFAIGFVGMLPWVFHYVLALSDLALSAVIAMTAKVASLSFATVEFAAISVSVAVVVIWAFIFGGYVNFNKLGKIIANSICCVLLILCIGMAFVKYAPQNQAYISYGTSDCVTVVTSQSGEMAVIGVFDDKYSLDDALTRASKYKVNACSLYFTDYEAGDAEIVEDILKQLPVQNAYVLDRSFNGNLNALFENYGVDVVRQIKNSSSGNDVTVRSVYDGELAGVVVNSGDLCVAVVISEDNNLVANFVDIIDYADVYALVNANFVDINNNTTVLTEYQTIECCNYGANKYGNFTITQKDDKIKLTFR